MNKKNEHALIGRVCFWEYVMSEIFEPIQEPVAPSDDECCESGCGELCVFEIYYEQKRLYEAYLSSQQNQSPKND